MNMRIRLSLPIALLALFCNVALAQTTVQPYLGKEQLPDLIKCLPAPPDSMSEHFAHDVMRYMWGKEQRKDKARADMALRDAVWSYEALVNEFVPFFGIAVNAGETPEIWKLLVKSLTTTDLMRSEPKAFYHRRRPFEVFNEHLLWEEEEEVLRGEGSYPSGHTMRGWTVAMLLAEINPDAADGLFARGWEYGESRVIDGAHWQSDVDVSRLAASIGVTALHTSPEFLDQMDRARTEYRKIMLLRAAGE